MYELKLCTISRIHSFNYLLLADNPQIYFYSADLLFLRGWMNALISFSTLHLSCSTNSIIKCEGKVEHIVISLLTSLPSEVSPCYNFIDMILKSALLFPSEITLFTVLKIYNFIPMLQKQ